MISDERLRSIAGGEEFRVGVITDMAQELLSLRPCQHHWNTLRLVEAGGRYQYCTLCGAKKVAE